MLTSFRLKKTGYGKIIITCLWQLLNPAILSRIKGTMFTGKKSGLKTKANGNLGSHLFFFYYYCIKPKEMKNHYG